MLGALSVLASMAAATLLAGAACSGDDAKPAATASPTVVATASPAATATTAPTATPTSIPPTSAPEVVQVLTNIPADEATRLTLPAAKRSIVGKVNSRGTVVGGPYSSLELTLVTNGVVVAPVDGTYTSDDTGDYGWVGPAVRAYNFTAAGGDKLVIWVSAKSSVMKTGAFKRGDPLLSIEGDAKLGGPTTMEVSLVMLIIQKVGGGTVGTTAGSAGMSAPTNWVSGTPSAFVP